MSRYDPNTLTAIGLMKKLIIHRVWFVTILVTIVATALSGRILAQSQDSAAVLDKILSDWRLRQERIGVVQYQLKGHRTWARGSFDSGAMGDDGSPLPPNPGQDTTGRFTRNVLLDLKRNHFRVENNEEKYDNLSRSLYTVRSIWVGDGKTVRVRSFEDSLPGLGKNRAKSHEDFWIMREDPEVMSPMIFESGFEPLFYAAGVVPANGKIVRPTHLVPKAELDAFSYQGRGTEDGSEHVIIRERTTDFWVDLKRDSSIVEVVVDATAPKLIRKIEYDKSDAGWLPKHWKVEQFADGRPVFSEDVEVERTILQPQTRESTFILNPTPGMYVREIQSVHDEAGGGHAGRPQDRADHGGTDRALVRPALHRTAGELGQVGVQVRIRQVVADGNDDHRCHRR